jgi:hypothetical protein
MWAFSLIALILLAGCAPSTPELTPTPVIAFAPTQDQPVPDPSASDPICPNADCVLIDAIPAPSSPLLLTLPTPAPEPLSVWRPPLYPVPWALTPYDHFYFSRPIAADQVNWPKADYRYGGVFFGEVVHTGVDIPATAGAEVIASAPGIVVWSGWGLFSGDPANKKDPYGIAVAIRHDFGYNGDHLYSLYAHMKDTNVMEGQYVNAGDVLGWVGDTGFTTGAHLHFEVRLGVNDYFHTRNPELWIASPQGWGVLAGRVMDGFGKPYPRTLVQLESVETGAIYGAKTYGPDSAISDAYYKENVVIGDLPAGMYIVRVPEIASRQELLIEIKPGRVSYFTFRGYEGFGDQFPPTPAFVTVTPSPTPRR